MNWCTGVQMRDQYSLPPKFKKPYLHPGIYRDETLADKLMYIPNDDETQNYPFCRLKLVVDETFDY